MKHVHFIGIAGSGLSAIALVLLERGIQVSGSDRALTAQALRLQHAGAQVYAGHRGEHIQGADVVVRSSAVPDDNVEVQAAIAAGIPVLKRAEFLGPLLAGRQVVAIAGTHGKTTTTAMIAWLLQACGQEPGFIIGGVSHDLGTNAREGHGLPFVIEADEYDRMFHGLQPALAVITNIEHDHPDCYPTPDDFFAAFRQFASQILKEGWLLVCNDDPGAAQLIAEVEPSARFACLRYGLEAGELDYRALDIHPNTLGGYSFVFRAAGESGVQVTLRVPGLHNVRNALAALGAVHCLGLSMSQAATALGKFSGTGRRFEVCGEANGILLINDYAHHPTEIRATLQAARTRYPDRRIWAVWQPHTYSRTRQLADAFANAFTSADQVIVSEIFAAREASPADKFNAGSIVQHMLHPNARYIPALDAVQETLENELRPGDVLLVLSAGDADRLCAELLDHLQVKTR